MGTETCLSKKHCTPCQGKAPPLSKQIISELLLKLGNDWSINDASHLYKVYLFNDFADAMNFANAVSIIAEKEAHHPNLTISWGKCAVEIWTHKIEDLTENDFILAYKIEGI